MLMEDEGMSFPNFGKYEDSKKVIVNLCLKIRFLNLFMLLIIASASELKHIIGRVLIEEPLKFYFQYEILTSQWLIND